MKKLTALILALALCLTLMAPALADQPAGPSVAIVVAGTLGDRSFYDSANEGRLRLENELGLKTTVIECREDGSQYENALVTAAEGYDVVVAVGWQFWDALAGNETTPGVPVDFPETKFMFIDNGLDGVGNNLMSVIYAQNQGSFLTGYIAGKMTATGKIGVVGGQNSDTINDFIVGYQEGAKYAKEDIVVDVKYTEDFEDPSKGKEAALAMYNAGCDIVFAVAGKTGEGVFEAAAETKNYAIGVDSDQKYINPDVIICSMVKDVGLSLYNTVANMDENFKGGQIWCADMATGYIGVAYGTEDMPQQVSDDLKAEVDELAKKIVSGEIVVTSTLQ